MQNGIAIIEKTDTETKGVFIDQDTIEFARLNAQTKKRIEQAEDKQRKENHNRRKAEKVAAQRKAYNLNTFKHIIIHCGTCGAVIWLGTAGMIHPVVWVPIALSSLCAACLRFGAWVGGVSKC